MSSSSSVQQSNRLLKILPHYAEAKTLISPEAFFEAGARSIGGVCVDESGTIYLSDSVQHVIFSISPAGKVNILAGRRGERGANGGKLRRARFNSPGGLAVDKSGTVYVADTGNNQIRVIKNGKVFKLFGGVRGYINGSALESKLSRPNDICVDPSGIVYVADTENHSIRKFDGINVTTVAGNGQEGDSLGVKTAARFSRPTGIAVNSNGLVYVADSGNRKIKVVNPGSGKTSLFCGSGNEGDQLGGPTQTSFRELREIWCDKASNIYTISRISDLGIGRAIKIDGNGNSYSLSQIQSEYMDNINGLAVGSDGSIYISVSEDIFEITSETSQAGETSSASSASSSQSSLSSEIVE